MNIKKIMYSLWLIFTLTEYKMIAIENNTYTTADGNRTIFKNRKFSIVPPWGWQIDDKSSDNRLLLLAPNKGSNHPANIQVIRYTGAINIYSLRKKDIYIKYIKKIAKNFNQVTNIYLDEPTIIEYKKGKHGLTFYTSFVLNNHNLMQSYLLISSINDHYILSFTDTASHFTDSEKNTYFDEAWKCLASIELKDAAYVPTNIKIIIIFICVTILLIMLTMLVLKKRKK